MTLTTEGGVDGAEFLIDAERDRPCWYAVYTSANHEKRVAEQIARRSVESFLPQYAAVRRWKDRRVRLNLPLFPGYVFVRMRLRDRLSVLQIPSVVRLVGFNGSPTALPDDEVEALRNGLARKIRANPHPYLVVGRPVRIIHGPLTGFEGILVRRKNSVRVVVSFDLIRSSIAVDIDMADLQSLSQKSFLH
jgi:transcription antitermination factor NusG